MKVGGSKLTGLIFVILLVSILLLGFYFLQAVFSPEVVEKKLLVGEYNQRSYLDFSAILKPNLIYEREEINGEEVLYSALLQRMDLIYKYSFLPELERVSGEYNIVLMLTPVKGGWEKEIGVYKGDFSTSVLEVSIPINWEMIIMLWKTIENETKYDFGDPNVKVLANLNIRGFLFNRSIEESLSHASNVTYGKIIKFSEVNKSKKDVVYEVVRYKNTINVLGYPLEVKNAKIILGAPFFAIIAALGIFTFNERAEIKNYISRRERRSFERKFRKRIVSVIDLPEYSRTVRVSNLKELAKLSYELDKPILKSENGFAVFDGDRVYVHNNDNNIIQGKE